MELIGKLTVPFKRNYNNRTGVRHKEECILILSYYCQKMPALLLNVAIIFNNFINRICESGMTAIFVLW